MTFENAHAKAEELAVRLAELGFQVGEIDKSVNRYNQKSAYFTAMSGRKFWTIRVSDHSSNWATAHCQVVTDDQSEALVDYMLSQREAE